MKRSLAVFLDVLRKCTAAIIAVCICFIVSAVVFYLYGLPLEPFLYAAALVAFAGLCIFIFFLAREYSKAAKREQMLRDVFLQASLPHTHSLCEKDYQTAVSLLQNELTRLHNDYASARQDDIDYYTAWVHQIKTPIAVMRLELGGCDSENSSLLEAELFRIEQYADMVLTYIRLGNDCNDFVIKEYSLDGLLREAVRKFAPQFVAKKLRLIYNGTDSVIITDKKWFSVIIEQIISNAIKYTPSGSISITSENGFLIISDTGIGIASEDIPRIFEKGFTGINGHSDKQSSGLGLYLCKKSADLLQIPLSVESTIGKGSSFYLDLNGKYSGNI